MKRRRQKGFALLIVVMLVALLAITAPALLDIVGVDLDIVGEQRRLSRARGLAEAATFEIADMTTFENNFPTFVGAHTLTIPTPAPGTSSLFKNVGSGLEERYDSTIALLRYTPGVECSFNVCRNAHYELTTVGSINNGGATSVVRSTIVKSVTHPKGKLLPRIHAR